jgi:hypothetical protein
MLLVQTTVDGSTQLWKVDSNGEDRKVTYLSTLVKHTQAVNVVRWCPRGAYRLNLHLCFAKICRGNARQRW